MAARDKTMEETETNTAGQAEDIYTLHFFPFSLYSLMVRFAFVLGKALNDKTAPVVHAKLVNLHKEEQLSEAYLTEVSPKGQVPALTSPALPAPLTDSRAISAWLCERQPELVPVQHRATIDRLMDSLYAFHAMSLLAAPEEQKFGISNDAAAKLERNDLPESYRRALEIRSVIHDTIFSTTLEPDNVADVEEKVKDFVQDLTATLEKRNTEGPWIFGAKPTIIDAHATAVAAVLMDIKRQDLLTEKVQEYAKLIIAREEWLAVTHGRKTQWNPAYSDAANLAPL